MVDLIAEFSQSIEEYVKKNLSGNIGVDAIKNSDGRDTGSLECCKSGSFIYYLYNKNNEIIYIGETGKSVKSRLFCDGSGSHCNKRWFSEVEYVKYYKDENMKYDYRKMIERTLILYYRDKYKLYNDNL